MYIPDFIRKNKWVKSKFDLTDDGVEDLMWYAKIFCVTVAVGLFVLLPWCIGTWKMLMIIF